MTRSGWLLIGLACVVDICWTFPIAWHALDTYTDPAFLTLASLVVVGVGVVIGLQLLLISFSLWVGDDVEVRSQSGTQSALGKLLTFPFHSKQAAGDESSDAPARTRARFRHVMNWVTSRFTRLFVVSFAVAAVVAMSFRHFA